jgi:hypothetical protein
MRLICLKCASPTCTCGRLALVHLNCELREDDVIAVTSPLMVINSAQESGDAGTAVDGLLVLRLRYNRDLPKVFRGE